jgi:ABC-2 type transport system permease protein
MNKTLIIFRREYLTRVTKKSFLILTLLIPLLFGGIMVFSIYLNTKESSKEQKVAVVDRSKIFLGELKDSKSTKFEFVPDDQFQTIKEKLKDNGYYALLEIPQNIVSTNKVLVYSAKQVSIDVKMQIDWQIERLLEEQKRAALVERIGIPDLEEQIKSTKAKISVETIKIGDDGESKTGSTEVAMIAGYIAGFVIYMFVFIYGSMVMRGVLEEKQNRIVEVIISSVKPVQLMMGKILGLAAVGLTQFTIWIVLLTGILFGIQRFMMPDQETVQKMMQSQSQSIMIPGTTNDAVQVMNQIEPNQVQEIMEKVKSLDFTMLLTSFFVFFILGYLLYSSLMAAVASAVDSEEDMNQFMMPVTIPLIIAIILLPNVIKDPEGAMAIWASFIPLTSPIIMMVRIPFGVAWWEVVLSMVLLALTTYGAIWIAGRIYRTGILMYGKKPTWKELGKWLTYKN